MVIDTAFSDWLLTVKKNSLFSLKALYLVDMR